ncbi:MAG: FG-GAP-like repeat-containing protein [Pirellulaceae bacterium]
MATHSSETSTARLPVKRWPVYLAILIVIGLLATWTLQPLPREEIVARAEQALEAEQFAKVARYADQILAREPSDLKGLQLAAIAASAQEDYHLALRYLVQIPSVDRPEIIGGTLGNGVATEELLRLSEIEKLTTETLARDPEHVVARDRLGFVLAISGQRWKGLSHFLDLIRRGNFTEVHLLWLGDIQRTVGTYDYLQRCHQANTNDPLPLLGLARIHIDRDQIKEARKLLEQVVEGVPGNIEAQAWLGVTLLDDPAGFLQWQQQLPPAADRHPETWVTRGKWALQNKQTKEAIRCFWEAVAREPNHRLANYQLGQLLLEAGENDQARVFLQRAEQLNELMKLVGIVGMRRGPLSPADEKEVQAIVSLAESLGRFWESWAWAKIAQLKNPRSIWPTLAIQRAVFELELDSPVTLARFTPTREVNLSDYPLPNWQRGNDDPGRKLPVANNPHGIGFVDDAPASGIQFQYVNGSQPAPRGPFMYEFTGGGVAVLDYDGDGWPDIYLTQGCSWPPGSAAGQHRDHLYRNLGNGKFADVTETAGLGDELFSQGVTVGDLNNDGFPDLYVANIGKNRLYLNHGDGTFEDISSQLSNATSRWTTSCLIADLNADGFPDIYDVNYLTGKMIFQEVCDGQICHPNEFNAEQDQLFLNNGQGTFLDATETAGITSKHGNGLGIVAADFSGRKTLDLFVANDAVANSFFKRRPSSADQLFDETATLMGLAFDRDGAAQACMGVAAGDANRDGLIDLFVTNYYRESNTLYQQQGGMFVDATRKAGLREPSFSWLGFGTQFLDADLDGHLDLVITNGHVDDYRKNNHPFEMPPQFLHNQGQARFQELNPAELGPYFQRRYRGRGLARIDWNRDGREDFVVSHLDTPASLLTNKTKKPGNYLVVQLVGTTSSRDAIGSRVTIMHGNQTWTAQLTAGDGYQASNQRQLVFGLGSVSKIEQLKVDWISGKTQSFSSPAVNSEIRIVEGNPTHVRLPNQTRSMLQD